MIAYDRRRLTLPLSLLFISLVTRVLLAYRGGMSDPDSVAIAAGMARYFSHDTSFKDIILYGRQMNPGIYLVFRLFYPALFDSPSMVIPFLNFIGVASAVILPVPLFYIFRRKLGDTVAAAAVLLFIFTPLVWESSLSFHPVLPAALLLSLACLTWRRIDGGLAGRAWFAVTCLLATGALVTRVEVVMLVPGFILAGALSDRRRRELSMLAAVLAVSLGTYWLILRLLPGSNATVGRGVSDYASYISEGWFSGVRPAGMTKTFIWFFFGAGAATLILVLRGLSRFRKSSSSKRDLAVSLVLILPTIIFWLPQPRAAILRHYFLIAPVLVWLAGDLVLSKLQSRRLVWLVCAAVAINLVLPEAVYSTWNRLKPNDAKTPHGTVFLYRSMISSNIRRYTAMQSGIREAAEKAAKLAPATEAEERGLPAGPFVPVNWESYAYAIYGMAQDTSLVKLEAQSATQDVDYHRFEMGGAEVRMVFSNYFTWDAVPDQLIPFMRSAAADGFTFVIPGELIGFVREKTPAGAKVIEY